MDYAAAINYLNNRLPAFERAGDVAYKPGLERIRNFCAAIGNPHLNYPVIHVGGTNGKGSTSSMLAAILQSAGYKTGLHVSPHLKSFSERARIDGVTMPEQSIADFLMKYQELIEQHELSYFEFSVAWAFHCFAKEKVDIAVIEVGMGGTYDATNIVQPILSIITNISADHIRVLGPSLQDIAAAKAGIIKANTPVVISQTQKEVADIFIEKAKAQNASIYFADHAYTSLSLEGRGCRRRVRVEPLAPSLPSPSPQPSPLKGEGEVVCQLQGTYQRHNIPGVLQAVECLRDLNLTIPDEAMTTGLQHCCTLTGFKARWQILQHNPLVIADGAHNKAGLQEVIAQIAAIPHQNLYAILGCTKEKDIDELLSLWPENTTFIFAQADIPRAQQADILYTTAITRNRTAHCRPNVNDAHTLALQLAQADDLIFIGGSLYLLGELDAL